MNTSAVVTQDKLLQLSDVSSQPLNLSSLLQVIDRALNEGYVTRSEQKDLLMALFVNQPLTSDEFKRLRKVCYYLQSGILRVVE